MKSENLFLLFSMKHSMREEVRMCELNLEDLQTYEAWRNPFLHIDLLPYLGYSHSVFVEQFKSFLNEIVWKICVER